MVTALVSYNSSLLSKFIRDASGDPASHFALCFDQKLVFHSNLIGCHPTFRKSFEKSNTVYKEILIPTTSLEQEEAIYLKCLEYDGKPYDYTALLYLMTVGLIKKIITGKIPTHNPWNDKDYVLCLEVAKCLDPVLKLDVDLTTTTPYQLINKLEGMLHG